MTANSQFHLPDSDLSQAVFSALSHAASQIIWPYFGQLDADMVRTKSSDTDFVTIADTRAEQYLSSSLLPLIEGADIIGEESTSQTGAIPKTLSDGYMWVVDPLDGTRNFVNKINRFCSMITLLHEGMPQAAWIYRIAEKDCFFAGRGRGVYYLDGTTYQRCAPSGEASFFEARGTANAMGVEEPLRTALRERLKTHKGRYHIGSAGLDAVALAQGRSEFVMHSKLTPWDSLPVSLFAQELGFVVKMASDESRFTPQKTGILMIARDEPMWQAFRQFVYQG